MNTRSTVTYTRPRYARLARLIENRLISLIDAGEDLALYYGPPAPSAPRLRQFSQWQGRATVIGDGGFRTVVAAPSREFEHYVGARNAEVSTGIDGELVIRLRDVKSRRSRAGRGVAVSSGPAKRLLGTTADAVYLRVIGEPCAVMKRQGARA